MNRLTNTPPSRTRPLLYTLIQGHLQSLIPCFGLQASTSRLIRAFNLLCADSLAIPNGRRNFSTLNEDGTPFQFSLQLGTETPALQFLAEVGSPALSDAARVRLAWQTLDLLASVLGCRRALDECRGLLKQLAVPSEPGLSTNEGSLFWIGIGFREGESPRLRIYVNTKWCNDPDSWWRLDTLAYFFGAENRWNAQKELLRDNMRPLGLSITMNGAMPPTGRVYARAYGNPLVYYENIARDVVSPGFAESLHLSAQLLLGEERRYPTKSVVCSFGLQQDRDFKCEMCGHCIFSNDTEASSRCAEWLSAMQVPFETYLHLVHVMTKDGKLGLNARLHSFVGIGMKHTEPYCTVYLNPGAVLYGDTAVSGDRLRVDAEPAEQS